MATTRDLKGKIKSLDNMQVVMGAMNMISSIKFARYHPGFEALRVFDAALEKMHHEIGHSLAESNHPLVYLNRAIRRIHIVIFTADRGLCGSHNNSLLKSLDQLITLNQTGAIGAELSCIGRKAIDHARHQNYEVRYQSVINEKTFTHESLRTLCDKLLQRINANEIQEVILMYDRFVSVLEQVPTTIRLLPFQDPHNPSEARPGSTSGSLEPNEPDEFLSCAAHTMLEFHLRSALSHSDLSEHAARMTAMENATKNAKELSGRYEKVRNRLRQSIITSELTEIISGKEALKDK